MNAKELHDYWLQRLDRPIDGTLAEKETILRALRLLAAAEGGEGTPEVDADLAKMKVELHNGAYRYTSEWSGLVSADFARSLELERNALAKRLAECEEDAARYVRLKAMLDHGGVTIRLIGEVDKLGIPLVTHEYTEWEPLQAAIDAARGTK